MLELENIVIRQDSFELRTSLVLKAQTRVAVVGPSGAGKSTLLAAVAGFLQPVSGRIIWAGQDITPMQVETRPCAMLFQEGNLFPHLTVWQNVALGVHPGLKLRQTDNERVRDALARVELDGYEKRKPEALSGGQQSRVALARVLLQDKPIILLDEPFAALGPALKTEMLALVGEIAEERGAMVLMVSHDPDDAKRFADEVIVVADGEAQAPREVNALFAAPPAALRAYLGDG